MSVVVVEKLSKTYQSPLGGKRVEALKSVSLAVEPGAVFGLLGRNGAGKTTLVKLLLGIAQPTAGSFSLFGAPAGDVRVKSRVGFLPENHRFPPFLSGEDALRYLGRLSGLSDEEAKRRIPEALELVRLSERGKFKVKSYSKGMMQRLGLAQATLHNPDLLFLDEPTDGVDPVGRKEIRDILLDLKAQGKTVFLNSHLLGEVEMVTDRVAILENGELVEEGDVKELTDSRGAYRLDAEDDPVAKLDAAVVARFKLERAEPKGWRLHAESIDALNEFVDLLRAAGVRVVELAPIRSTLEDVFITKVATPIASSPKEGVR